MVFFSWSYTLSWSVILHKPFVTDWKEANYINMFKLCLTVLLICQIWLTACLLYTSAFSGHILHQCCILGEVVKLPVDTLVLWFHKEFLHYGYLVLNSGLWSALAYLYWWTFSTENTIASISFSICAYLCYVKAVGPACICHGLSLL